MVLLKSQSFSLWVNTEFAFQLLIWRLFFKGGQFGIVASLATLLISSRDWQFSKTAKSLHLPSFQCLLNQIVWTPSLMYYGDLIKTACICYRDLPSQCGYKISHCPHTLAWLHIIFCIIILLLCFFIEPLCDKVYFHFQKNQNITNLTTFPNSQEKQSRERFSG